MTTFGKEKKKSDRLGTSRQRSHLAKNHDENWHFPKLLFYNLGIRLNEFQHKNHCQFFVQICHFSIPYYKMFTPEQQGRQGGGGGHRALGEEVS